MKTEEEIRTEMVRLRKELTKLTLTETSKIALKRSRESYILGQLAFATWILNN